MPFFILKDQSVLANCQKWLDGNWQKNPKRPLMVEITPLSAKRTDRQSRYYWVSLQDYAGDAKVGECKYSKDAWHEYFRGMFLGRVDLPDGTTAPVSTTSLSVVEFNEYIERINLWTSTELGIQFGKSPEEFGGF